MGIREVKTAPRSPWQNPYVERLIGTLRRECLDHVVVLNETHLRRVLRDYLTYYHRCRTHLSLEKDAPEPRPVERLDQGEVIEMPMVGGLHLATHRLSLLPLVRPSVTRQPDRAEHPAKDPPLKIGLSLPHRNPVAQPYHPSHGAEVATSRGNKLASETADNAETRVTTVVAPRGHATSAVLARLYLLLQAYACLRFRPLGGWALKPRPLK